MPLAPRPRALGWVAALAFVAACTGDDVAVPDPTVATTTTVAVEPRVDDGRLRIGALFPVGDALIGPSIEAAAQRTVDLINASGGVFDQPVELVIADEGTSTPAAASGIDALLGEGVDAVLGPTSSVLALSTLDAILDAGVLACSPSASALRLDDFPDADSLFFRTIPSDSLQAVAIAEVVETTGAGDAVIVHVDDPYGRPFATATSEALEDNGVVVSETIAVSPTDDDFVDEATALVETGTRTAVVLGTGADTSRFLDALSRIEFNPLRTIVVNDAARDAAARPVVAAIESQLRERVTGVGPEVILPDTIAGALAEADLSQLDTGASSTSVPADTDTTSSTATTTTVFAGAGANPYAGPFAAQVVDCINLIALAAAQAGSDAPTAISRQMSSVAAGGSICRSFAECVADLEQRLQIDYNGPSGVTELGRSGDPTRAVFDVFTFDDDGRDQTVDRFQATG